MILVLYILGLATIFGYTSIYVWTGWTFFSCRNRLSAPSRPVDEGTLERWHDAYDAALLEGWDEAEAVRVADLKTVVPPLQKHYPSRVHRNLKSQPNPFRGDYIIGPLPPHLTASWQDPEIPNA